MNTLENLIDKGIEKSTAVSMLESYSSKIGSMSGVYEITDITYDFKECGRDVELKCTLCGRTIHRIMIKGRNKWSELIKTCPCQKEKKLQEKIAASVNLKNQKRAIIENRVGKIYGDYTVISVEDISGIPKYAMQCNECGYEKIVCANAFDRLNFKCHKHFQKIKYDDSYIGRRFNFLTVIGIERDQNNKRVFRCNCDCGSEKLYTPFHVVNGIIKSCGCMHDELLKTHGLSNTRLYRIWRGMNARCFDKKSVAYENYGGRGITICDEWLGGIGLLNFVAWAETHGYSDDLSIDRIDVNGNYEPNNCRWADVEIQIENRRPCCEWKKRKPRVSWTISGITKPAKVWCDEYNVSYETAMYRINHNGMSIFEALTAAKMPNGRPKKGHTT